MTPSELIGPGIRIAALSLAVSCGSVAIAEFPFEPDPTKSASILDEGTWTEAGPGFVVHLELMSEQQRLAYLEENTGYRIDPFATPPDQDPRYLSFLLEVGNDGNGTIMLQPQACWLTTNKTEILSPLGIDGLRSTYKTVEMEMAPAYERARPAVLESSLTVAPGETVRGLLVYRMFKPKTKRFQLDLQLTLPNGEVVRMSAPYRKVAEQKKKKEKTK